MVERWHGRRAGELREPIFVSKDVHISIFSYVNIRVQYVRNLEALQTETGNRMEGGSGEGYGVLEGWLGCRLRLFGSVVDALEKLYIC